MKRVFLAGGIAGAAFLALWTPAQPAGACSVACETGSLELELVEVRLVEAADPDAAPELPVVAESGSIDAWGSAWFDDNTWFSWSPEADPTEEVTR